MRGRKQLSSALAGNDKLNYELLPGVPIIEICDRERVLIENHRGIIGYGCDMIQIKVRYGCICIHGNRLKMSRMSKTKLVITGVIDGVTLQGREVHDAV